MDQVRRGRPRRWRSARSAPVAVVALFLVTVTGLAGCTSSDDGHSSVAGGRQLRGGDEAPPPDDGTRWVVSLGDSYISGEGARWGANSRGPDRQVDALGPNAYFDAHGQESEPGCHRASSTIVDVTLPGLRGKDLACSGATTRSDASGLRYKPGLDFAHEPDGNGIGQALALQRFASGHRVAAVVVSIGGNEFGFGALAGSCVTGYFSSSATDPRLCSRDPAVSSRFDPAARARVQQQVAGALDRVTTAMTRAGYTAGDYRRIVLTYPSPVPAGDRLRYSDADRDRRGGCPLFAADATWADRVVLPAINTTVRRAAAAASTPFDVLDLTHAFAGHRLCERGTSQLSDTGLRAWDAPGAVDRVEWVNRVYETLAPHQVVESLHPDYWGTAAERACLRGVLSQAARPAYTCLPGSGLEHGDPRMRLR